MIWLLMLYFILLATLLWLLFRASPPPASYPVSGVGIKDGAGYLHFYGRRLDCRFDKNQPYPADCTIELTGNLLEIQVGRLSLGTNPPYSLTCTAVFNGQPLPCHNGLRHSERIPPTHIFLDEPLDLSAAEMTQLRQRFWLENLPEYPYRQSRWVIALLSTLFIVAGFNVLLSRQWQHSMRYLTLVLIAVCTFLIAYAALFLLTSHLWD